MHYFVMTETVAQGSGPQEDVLGPVELVMHGASGAPTAQSVPACPTPTMVGGSFSDKLLHSSSSRKSPQRLDQRAASWMTARGELRDGWEHSDLVGCSASSHSPRSLTRLWLILSRHLKHSGVSASPFLINQLAS